MTPGEYRAARQAANLTQRKLAARLGVHWNTVARRERGERPIPPEAAAAIQWVTRHSDPTPE